LASPNFACNPTQDKYYPNQYYKSKRVTLPYQPIGPTFSFAAEVLDRRGKENKEGAKRTKNGKICAFRGFLQLYCVIRVPLSL
jgi:hypothetical protein